MKRAAVSTIKATLSACLAKVKAGEELLVMERGKPVAKLVPVSTVDDAHDGGAHLRAWLVRDWCASGPASCLRGFGRCLGSGIARGERLPLSWTIVLREDEVLGCVGGDPAMPD